MDKPDLLLNISNEDNNFITIAMDDISCILSYNGCISIRIFTRSGSEHVLNFKEQNKGVENYKILTSKFEAYKNFMFEIS